MDTVPVKELPVDIRILKRCKPYLRGLNRTPINFNLDLLHFGEVQGEAALHSMERFISYAEEHEFGEALIVKTLAHDLYSCDKDCFSPRTSSY